MGAILTNVDKQRKADAIYKSLSPEEK